MQRSASSSHRRKNRILARLPATEYRRISAALQPKTLPVNHVILSPGRPVHTVYFLCVGACSISRSTGGGRAAEIASVGSEGLVGIEALFGRERVLCRATVTIADIALAMPVSAFHREMRRHGKFAALVNAYAQHFVTSLIQSVACNALHTVEERCARWLLTMRDLAGGNDFVFTQESLARVLGVRRATVTLTIGALRAKGLIDYGRGRLHIVDPRGLKSSASCECYTVLRKHSVRRRR
jgi:CRP-like cAMP-binding protein